MSIQKRFFLISTLLILLIISLSPAAAADSTGASAARQIQLNAYVENSRVPLNRPVVFHVEVSWPGNLSDYQIEPLSQPVLTNLLLEGSGSENRLDPLGAGKYRAVKSITYRFKPLEMGMAYIDGIVVKYTDKATGQQDQLTSQRIMVEIVDPLPEADGPRTGLFIYGILLALFFGIVFYSVFLYFRKRRAARSGNLPVTSLPEIFLNRLGQEVDPRGTNLAEMTQKLSRIFREYLDQDFGIPARELSTDEIVERFAQMALEEEEKDKIADVLRRLDLIKFAGKNVDPAEFTTIYGTIETFLIKRKNRTATIHTEEQEAS